MAVTLPNLRNLNLKGRTKSVASYLNGRVDFRFTRHPAFRWGLIAAVAVYLILGVIVSWKVYKVKSESLAIRRVLTIYPLPAVIMPTDIISVRNYLDQLSYIRHFAEQTKEPLPSDDQVRQQLIGQLIETRLLIHETQKNGIKVTRADVDAVYQRIAEANGGPQELKKLLNDLYGISEKSFRIVIRDQLLREKIRKELLTQVEVKHILMQDQKKAQEVLDQIKADPTKFDELAKQNSQDTATRDKGGKIDFFGRGIMTPPFEEAAFKLGKGELSPELIKTDFGYHILMVTDKKGRVDKTYDTYLKELKEKKKAWVIYK